MIVERVAKKGVTAASENGVTMARATRLDDELPGTAILWGPRDRDFAGTPVRRCVLRCSLTPCRALPALLVGVVGEGKDGPDASRVAVAAVLPPLVQMSEYLTRADQPRAYLA